MWICKSADFVRVGVFGRWRDPYLTMSAQFESVIAGAFVEFLDRGYVYKGLKTVNWCIHDRTALAEAEIEYENHTSPSIWVRFALTSDPALIDPALAGRKVYGLIWTTTPWTIPANVAIAYHPKFEYVAVEVGEDVYTVAVELLKATAEKLGWSEPKAIAGFAGSKLEGAIFKHPFLERDSIGILAEHVTLDQGTGAVHTAPGHGQEDFEVGSKYGLPIYCPVDAAGKFFHAEGAAGRLPEEIIGKTVWQANPMVIGILKSNGALLAHEDMQHSYPHCWRCHHADDFPRHRAVVHRNGAQRSAVAHAAGHQTRQVDASVGRRAHQQHDRDAARLVHLAAARLGRADHRVLLRKLPGTVDGSHDSGSCSGVVCGAFVRCLVRALVGRVDWTGRSLSALQRARVSQGKRYSRRLVRFGIESSSRAHSEERFALAVRTCIWRVADQYRGWFHSSLLVGVALRGEAPYRECATNGWTLDEQGRAMSKSLGIGIHPEEIIRNMARTCCGYGPRRWISPKTCGFQRPSCNV